MLHGVKKGIKKNTNLPSNYSKIKSSPIKNKSNSSSNQKTSMIIHTKEGTKIEIKLKLVTEFQIKKSTNVLIFLHIDTQKLNHPFHMPKKETLRKRRKESLNKFLNKKRLTRKITIKK